MKKVILLALFCMEFRAYSQNLEVVGGYFPYWRSTSSCNFSHYNYLYFAFIECTPTGGLTFPGSGASVFNSFKMAAATGTAKKMISVGSAGMAAMASNPTFRQQFADTLRKFCRYHDLQGIDMDWEAIQTSTDRTNFTSLMIDIRSSIDTTDLEFSITVGYGNYWLQWYENNALDQADFLQIMVYDQTGTWPGSPFGNHASMQHFLDAETYWVGRGYPRSKLVMGLPYYGYKFSSTSGGLATAVTYADIITRFPSMLSSDNYLSDASGYYWFNGIDLIKEKTTYAIDNGFKGVFVWELAQDNINHILSLDNTLYTTVTNTTNIVSATNKESSIEVYPNPVIDELFIKCKINDISSIQILNIFGEVVGSFTSNEPFSLLNYPKGIYIVSILKNNGQVVVKKIEH